MTEFCYFSLSCLDYGQLKKLQMPKGNDQQTIIGHTHSIRFFYNSQECVSLNSIECRYFL